MSEILEKINGYVWGNGLVFLLLITGIIFTLKLRFIQFKLPVFLIRNRKTQNSGLSQFKTVCMSLGTTMGTGNITGAVSALAIGGAGSVFWMWVSAFSGMAVVYAENILSAKYSDDTAKGPMAYLSRGLKCPALAYAFAVFCVLASFGMGGMVQVNTFTESLSECCGFNKITAFVIIFIIIYIVTSGGAERIGNTAQYLLPAASAAYTVICIAVLFIFRENIISVIKNIFTEAFDFRSAVGGFSGYAVSVGIRRGIFSNEAGLGSSPVLHSAAGETSAHSQGMWSMFEVFFDTMICCTLTAVTVLCSSGSLSISETFSSALGNLSTPFITAELGIFAFCTVTGWYYCGETAFRYIIRKETAGKIFCIIYGLAAASGAVFTAESVWTVSDIFNGLMAVPNLLGLLLLMNKVGKNKPE